MACGIYAIKNLASGRHYVGSSIQIEARWRQHRRFLRLGQHHSPALQRSWVKHGAEAFAFMILEECDRADLHAREQCWIDTLNAACPRRGFNAAPLAGTTRGFKHSKETRAKYAANSRRYFEEHPEARERMREVGRRNGAASKGRALTDEARAANSAARIGNEKFRASSIANLSKITPEQRLVAASKISAKAKGRPIHANRAITYEQAEEIRALKAAGKTYRALSAIYGLEPSCLVQVVKRRTYQRP